MRIEITIVAITVHLQSADMLDCHASVHLLRYQKWTEWIANIISIISFYISCFLSNCLVVTWTFSNTKNFAYGWGMDDVFSYDMAVFTVNYSS